MDAGSKDGYGSHIISYFARSITLVDSRKDFIVKSRYFNFFCPTENIICDFEKSFPQGQWDVIIAFEIIEHLENPDFFLENVKKHLSPGGILIFSIPHEAVADGHKHLYNEGQAKKLIESHFKIFEWYKQDKSVIAGRPMLQVPTPLTYVGVATL